MNILLVLPEFPKALKSIEDTQSRVIFDALGFSDPLMAEVPVRRQREGDTWKHGEKTVEFKRASSTITWKPVSGRGVPFEEFFSQAQNAGAEIAAQQAKSAFEMLEKEGPKNITFSWNSGDDPLESFLSGMERIEIDFDENGSPEWPSVFLGEWGSNELAEHLRARESDPNFQQRYEEIVAKKKEEFHEREARRRLVD